MTAWTEALPYFSRSELACKGSGVIKLDLRFAAALPALRSAWGEPLTPTSVCRTPEHNESVSGHPRSFHLTDNPVHPTDGCMAADLAWRGWEPQKQLDLARLAWKMGWAIGVHDGFIHIDRRKDIGLSRVVFVYGWWSSPFNQEDIF